MATHAIPNVEDQRKISVARRCLVLAAMAPALLIAASTAVILVAIVFVLVAPPAYTYVRVLRRGYNPPGAIIALVSSYAVGVLACVWLVKTLDDPEVDRYLLPITFSPVAFAYVAMALFVLLLPRQGKRSFGARRKSLFPKIGGLLLLVGTWTLFPGILIMLGRLIFDQIHGPPPLGSALDIAFYISSAMVVVGFIFFPTGGYLVSESERIASIPTLSKVLETDRRAPVLFIRAFEVERRAFVMYGRGRNIQQYTLEQFLKTQLREQLGQFVALGSPEDYVQPDGAIRKYASDNEWTKDFEELAHMARCILLEVGKSSNLRWELSYLRRTGLHTKLLLLTRPDVAAGYAKQWAVLRMFWWLTGSPEIRWEQFVGDLKALGYDVGSDPGPGAIVAFDDSVRGMILMTGATSASDYVKTIREWCAALVVGDQNSVETVRPSRKLSYSALFWRDLEEVPGFYGFLAALSWIVLIFVLMLRYLPEGYENVRWAALTPILIFIGFIVIRRRMRGASAPASSPTG